MERPSRIVVLYNTDFDAQEASEARGDSGRAPSANIDVSSVAASARAIHDALVANGYTSQLRGMHGTDVFEMLAKLRADRPDLVFNLCESMEGDARNEPTLAGRSTCSASRTRARTCSRSRRACTSSARRTS